MDNEATIMLRKIGEDIAEIKTSQRVMERDLAHHIRRTDLAEENMANLRSEMEPVKRHVARLEGAGKFIGIIALIAAAMASILRIIKP